MRGLAIRFTREHGPHGFSFKKPLVDFNTTVQNALVNLGTMQGSDPLYPTRGTYLLNQAVSGTLISQALADNAATLAAHDTLLFLQATDTPNNDLPMTTLTLQSTQLLGQELQLAVQAIASDGEIRGRLISI